MRIAFVKLGDFSHINPNLIGQLERTFPDAKLDIFDVKALVRQRPDLLLRSLPTLLREYGRDIIQRKKRARDCLLITSFMFDQIGQLMRQQLAGKGYAWTFQTQSLFDASQPGLPHFVYTDHTVLANLNYPIIDRRRVLYSKPWLRRERAIYANANYVFAASNFARDSIIADYDCPPEQVLCVYTGVNVRVPDPAGPKPYTNPEILFVGVEWERKGGPQVVAAFKRVLEQRPDAQLTIIGCSPEVDLPNVNVVGRIAPQALPPYFERASLFCLPAWIEPAGIAYAEAALYRLPVVATPIGGIPDRVVHGETGYLIPPGDVSALSEHLLALLNNPERCAEFGAAGRRRAEQLFSWDHVGDRIAAAVQSVLDPHTNQRSADRS